MPELRETIKKELVEALDSTVFTADDFDVEYGSVSTNDVFMLSFKHDSGFYFEVTKESTGRYGIRITPGSLETSEYLQAQNFPDVINSIDSWAHEVRNELKAKQPVYREIEELRKIIEESIKSSVTEEEEFSVAEINELRKKFDALEAKVAELEANQIITDTQMQKFSENIQQVSDDIEVYPKETWIKISINKLTKTVSAIGKTNEARAIIADGARKLLGLD